MGVMLSVGCGVSGGGFVVVGRILRCPVKVGLRGAGGFAVFGSVPAVAVFEEFGGHQTFVLVAFVVGSCDAC